MGQEHAKRVLSVAVYNHYKRIYNNLPIQPVQASSRHDMAIMEQGPNYSFTQRGMSLGELLKQLDMKTSKGYHHYYTFQSCFSFLMLF